MYTKSIQYVARGSLLSDTVITKIQTTVGSCISALSWLIPGTNSAENQERFLHIVAQETINLNVALAYLNLMRHKI